MCTNISLCSINASLYFCIAAMIMFKISLKPLKTNQRYKKHDLLSGGRQVFNLIGSSLDSILRVLQQCWESRLKCQPAWKHSFWVIRAPFWTYRSSTSPQIPTCPCPSPRAGLALAGAGPSVCLQGPGNPGASTLQHCALQMQTVSTKAVSGSSCHSLLNPTCSI